MHREGHYGTTLAAASVLLIVVPVSVAIYGTGIMLLFATLPDKDHRVSKFVQNSRAVAVLPNRLENWLKSIFRHRGIIHTYLFGFMLAGAVSLSVAVPLFMLNVSTLPVGIFTDVSASPIHITGFVFAMVFYSWVVHIYTDALTVGSGRFGVKPYYPFSNRQLRFGFVKAANKYANAGLLLTGLLLYGGLFYYRVVELSVFSAYALP